MTEGGVPQPLALVWYKVVKEALMITITPPRREPRRNRVRRNVLLNGRQIGYIAKPDAVENWIFEPIAVRHHYVWIASAGGALSCYHTEVGAVARVIANRSLDVARAVLENKDEEAKPTEG